MDACDNVMEKINRPLGLIRVDSLEGITSGTRSVINTRSIAYLALFLALIGLEGFLFAVRGDVEALLLRTPGMLYHENRPGIISNLYNYQIDNKTKEELEVRFVIEGFETAEIEYIGQAPTLMPSQEAEGLLFIHIPREDLTERSLKLRVKAIKGERVLDELSTTFFSPVSNE